MQARLWNSLTNILDATWEGNKAARTWKLDFELRLTGDSLANMHD